jgi:hypothetical protein
MLNTESMYQMPEGIETRWASPENWDGEKGAGGKALAGRKGSPAFTLKAGASQVLAHAEGTSGTVRRIWATINDRSPKMLRGLRIDMFWDGAESPAVSAPFGDFFGQGLGRCSTFESALFSNPEGRSFNCSVPMPFRTAMKIVVSNETDTDLQWLFYDINYTLGDLHDENTLYLHAHWRRERPTTFKQDYHFLPQVRGRGRFLGVNVGVIADTETYFKSWWGEGECKVYLDGDTEFPTLCGTGTEDYIGTAWGQGQYAHLYQGCHLGDKDNYQYNFYRYHIQDPIYFQQDIRITMHQIGCWGPDTIPLLRDAGRELMGTNGEPANTASPYHLFERVDDWSSCAYFYLNQPENTLPPLAPVEERTAGLLDSEGSAARADA